MARMDEAMAAPAARVDDGVRANAAPDFEAFFELHHLRLFRALWLLSRNRHEAEELMQDAFLKVLERWPRVGTLPDPEGYLYRTAMNLFRSRLRRAAVAVRRTFHQIPAADQLALVDERDAVVRALAPLTPRQRGAVVLMDVLGFTSGQAGAALGSSPATMRVLAAPGRARLRQEMVMNDLGERLRRASEQATPSGQPFERLLRRRDRRRRRERLLAVGVSFALVATVFGGVLFALGRAGSRTGHRTPLDGQSGNGGPARHGNQVLALGDGEYLYVRFHQVMPGWDFTQQSWWATDGSGRTTFVCSTDGCNDPNCQGQNGCSGYSGLPDGEYGPGEVPADSDLSGLSTDPGKLLPQLLARTAPGGQSPEPPVSPGPELTPGVTVGGLLYAIFNILRDPNGTPELKAAVYAVAAGLGGVTVHEGATDPVGRSAAMLEWSLDGSSKARYYFDPDTHLLIASSWAGQDGMYAVYDQASWGPPTTSRTATSGCSPSRTRSSSPIADLVIGERSSCA